jgi:hypothetical protein
MIICKETLYKEYKEYKKNNNINIDDWFKYSGLIEYRNKIRFKKYTYSEKILNPIVTKNDMTKYKLKNNKNVK